MDPNDGVAEPGPHCILTQPSPARRSLDPAKSCLPDPAKTWTSRFRRVCAFGTHARGRGEPPFAHCGPSLRPLQKVQSKTSTLTQIEVPLRKLYIHQSLLDRGRVRLIEEALSLHSNNYIKKKIDTHVPLMLHLSTVSP